MAFGSYETFISDAGDIVLASTALDDSEMTVIKLHLSPGDAFALARDVLRTLGVRLMLKVRRKL